MGRVCASVCVNISDIAMSKLLLADPSLLALPPLGADESICKSGARTCRPIQAALPKMGPVGFNLFGCHDIYQRGTHSEPAPHADPFIMCAAIKADKAFKPPFCAHPHCGASVASILIQGGAIRPWDNVQGSEAAPLLAGGIYHVDTGAGCVHDEPMEAVALRPRTKPGFADDEPNSLPCDADDDRTWMLQLWWNAICMDEPAGTPLRPVRSQVVAPESVPREQSQASNGLFVRCLAGDYRGTANVLDSSSHAVMLLHVRVEPNADGVLGPLPCEFNGFVWVLDGAVSLGGGDGDPNAPVRAEHGGETGLVLLPPGGDTLRVQYATPSGTEAAPSKPAQLFIGLGRPHRKPYVKYVGYGGGLIHRTVDEAMAAMAEYESDPKAYGRAAAGGAAKPVDTSAYELVSGFQSNGGDMMERPADVVARFKYKDGP